MSNEVVWTEKVLEEFIKKGNLNPEQEYIMRSRCHKTPVSQQATYLNCSESSVHRKIAEIKKVYDAVQKEYPEIFPVRKSSKQESWMDKH